MRVEDLHRAAVASMESLGGDLVDPPVLMPASLPLELSGEAVRARLCVFPDANGHDMALRPDLTLAVAKSEAEDRKGGARGETLRRYSARAFRLPSTEGLDTEFTQVGFERFGAPSTADTDIKAFRSVYAAATVGAPKLGETWLGDLSIVPAILDGLSLDPATTDALKRAFRQRGGIVAYLNSAARDASDTGAVTRALKGASPEDAESLVRHMLTLAGVTPTGERGIDEVAERLLAKAESGSRGALPEATAALLLEILALSGPARETLDKLAKVLNANGLSGIDHALDRMASSLDAIEDLISMDTCWFAVSFGRRFTYYDGFLFEIFGFDAPMVAPLAAGGRYDGLIGSLTNGAVDVTAIGGVVRPDRMALAEGGR